MFTILGEDGKEYGPVTAGNVIQWIHDGRANLQTKARLDRENVWKTLGDFAEFNSQIPVVSAVPPVIAPTPETPPVVIDSDAAGYWLRLPAAMIDGLLKTLCYLPISIPMVHTVMSEALSGRQRSLTETSQLVSEMVTAHLAQALPWFGLLVVIQFCLLAWRGQSVGKFLLGLRIVCQSDGLRAGASRAFLLRGAVPFTIEQIPGLGLLFWFVDSCLIFRNDHRCLHDLIAGTKVVRA